MLARSQAAPPARGELAAHVRPIVRDSAAAQYGPPQRNHSAQRVAWRRPDRPTTGWPVNTPGAYHYF